MRLPSGPVAILNSPKLSGVRRKHRHVLSYGVCIRQDEEQLVALESALQRPGDVLKVQCLQDLLRWLTVNGARCLRQR